MKEISGKANIKLENSPEKELEFSVRQDATGGIFGVINVINSFHSIKDFPKIEWFNGTTDSDFSFSIIGAVIDSITYNSNRKDKAHFYASEVKLNKSTAISQKMKVKFYLTNFIFSGNRGYLSKSTKKKKYYKRELVVFLDNMEIIFRPVPGYGSIEKALKANKDTRITATMEFSIENMESEMIAKEKAEIILKILSFAKGTKVNWIYYNVYTANRIIAVDFQNRITKRYSSFVVLNEIPDVSLVSFLECAYSSYSNKCDKWRINKIIDAICDSKQEGDFLENRALKSVAVLESLNSSFQNNYATGHIIDPNRFEEKEKDLQEGINEVLMRVLEISDKTKINGISGKIKGMNRKSFRNSIKEMHIILNIKPNKDQINHVVIIRNSLVHSLTFQNEIRKSDFEKYKIILSLNDRIVLAILGYHGSYYNWQNQQDQNMAYSVDNLSNK